jgi:hypothetical protein
VDGQSVPFTFEASSGQLSADLSRLEKGQHQMSVELADHADNVERSLLAQVLAGPLQVAQTAAYPNPSRSPVNLAVILDGNGSDDPGLDIEARIYNIAGQRIFTLPLGYKSNRTFTARWDCRDEDGRSVANGVYPYKIVIRRGGDELKANGKIAILR